jgi:thiamine pyrophosphate-dependent acetolactate synthase large subunit-like protein
VSLPVSEISKIQKGDSKNMERVSGIDQPCQQSVEDMLKSMFEKMSEDNQKLLERMSENNQNLEKKMSENNQNLEKKMSENSQNLEKKLDENNKRISETNQNLTDFKEYLENKLDNQSEIIRQ